MLNSNPVIYKKVYWLAIVLSLMISEQLSAQIFPIDTLMKSGNRQNRINLVFLAEGYQGSEENDFIRNAEQINNDIFSQEPFKSYKTYFNTFAVKVVSKESGAKHPGAASDEPSFSEPIVNPDNYFQSSFDYSGIHRLLVPLNHGAVFNVLAENIPDYDQAFVVVNSPFYGGSGGQFASSSTHQLADEIAIHEIGHSFGGLADEYWAGPQFAMEKPNMTRDNNPATVKWKNWYGINGIGIYPYGITVAESQWFRPHEFCKMRLLGYPFCSVCSERLVDRMHELVYMIDGFSPSATAFSLSNTETSRFSVFPVENEAGTQHINWYINDSLLADASDQREVFIPQAAFSSGDNTVKAEVIDNTALSKTYFPAAGYIHSVTWAVSKAAPAALPVKLKSFSGRLLNNKSFIEWKIDNNEDLLKFELERSNDGINFSKIATVDGRPGVTAYNFTDINPLGKAYYRLRMIEKNSIVNVSHTIWLQNSMDKFVYKVYQSPQVRNYHLLCTSMNNKEQVSLQLFNTEGALILSKDFGKINNQLDYDINLSGKPAGVYFLHIKSNNQQYIVRLLAN